MPNAKFTADFSAFYDAVKKAEAHLGDLSKASAAVESTVKRMAGAVAAAFTVDKILAFGSATVQLGSHISNLSAQTQASAEAIQRWAQVGETFGVDIDTIAHSMDQLGAKLVSNQSEVLALGLSMNELVAASPDQRMLMVATALGSIENPAIKARIANDLLGKSFAAMLGVLNKDLPNALKNVNGIMSDQTVKTLHEFDVQTKELSQNLHVFAAEALGGVAQGLNTIIDNFNKGKHIWASIGLFVPGAIGQMSTTKLANDMAAQAAAGTSAAAKGAAGPSLPATTSADLAGNLLRGYTAEYLKPLTAEQERFLQQLYDINKLTDENAQLMGVSASQVEAFKTKEDQLIETQGRLATQIREMRDLSTELSVRYAAGFDKMNEKAMALLETQTRLRAELMQQGQAAIDALNTRGAAAKSPFDQALAARDQAYQGIANKEALTPGVTVNGVDVFSAMRAKAEAEFDDAIAKLNAGANAASTALSAIAPSADAVTAAFAKFSGGGPAFTAPQGAFGPNENPTVNLFNPTAHAPSILFGTGGQGSTAGIFANQPTNGIFHVTVNGVMATDEAALNERIARGIEQALRQLHRF